MDPRLMRFLRNENLIFFVYSLALVAGISTHEMWTDETRPWIIVRDLALPDLFGFLRNEFHPPGWYFIVKALNVCGFTAPSMKLVSGTFALLAFWLLLKRSPFSQLQKVLFAGNAYLLYQYGVMARPYTLEVFLLFALCSIYHERKERRGTWLGLVLLLAMSHAFGLMLAPLFFLRTGMDFFSDLRQDRRILISGIIILCVLAATVILMDPLGSNLSGILELSPVFHQRIIQAISFTFQSVFLVLPFSDNWWGRSIWSWTHFPAWPALILSIPAFFLLFRETAKDRFAFIFFLYAWAVVNVILVVYVFAGFNLSHLGQVFIALVCCLWILRKSGGVIFTGILLLQAVAGIHMLLTDVRKPFTTGPEVAAWLSDKTDVRLVADVPYFSSAWIVDTDKKLTFPDGSLRAVPFGDRSIMTDMVIEKFVLMPYTGLFLRSSGSWLRNNLSVAHCSGGKGTLLITNYEIPQTELPSLCLSEQRVFRGALNPMENFRIYSFAGSSCNVKCL